MLALRPLSSQKEMYSFLQTGLWPGIAHWAAFSYLKKKQNKRYYCARFCRRRNHTATVHKYRMKSCPWTNTSQHNHTTEHRISQNTLDAPFTTQRQQTRRRWLSLKPRAQRTKHTRDTRTKKHSSEIRLGAPHQQTCCCWLANQRGPHHKHTTHTHTTKPHTALNPRRWCCALRQHLQPGGYWPGGLAGCCAA